MSLHRDSQTFINMIEANKGIIYKIANAYCHDEENRKDLIQEITIQLWLAFPRYDEQFRITTWMYRIALNVSISFYRKARRRDFITEPLHSEIISLATDFDTMEIDANITLLHKFIKELKEIDRAIILLYLEENSQQEIADILGMSATNVSTKISRIKVQLKQKFSTLKS